MAKPKASEDNSAVALLTRDHRKVKELFVAYQKLVDDEVTGDDRHEIADQICLALVLHATVEEEIFYPAVREAASETADTLDKAEVEHASLKDLITQIQDMDPDDALYNAKVIVLGEYVDHHVEEEEGTVFVQAKMSKLNLETLGDQLVARKQELLDGGFLRFPIQL